MKRAEGVDQVVEEVKITQVPVIKAATEVQETVEAVAVAEMKEAVAKLPLIP
jgi:hypothetical protein